MFFVEQQPPKAPLPPGKSFALPLKEQKSSRSGRSNWLWLYLGLGRLSWQRPLRELEQVFADRPQSVPLAKAVWLTQCGRRLLNWGRHFPGRRCLAEAITVKKDFFPAYVGLSAAYRQMTRATGLGSFACTALDLLDSVPQEMELSGQRVALNDCGAAVFAEMHNNHLLLGDQKQAADSLARAIQCHQRAQALDPATYSFFEQVGCTLNPAHEDQMRQWLQRLQSRISLEDQERP